MATITAAGIGSGLDVESIVNQLMEIEREPLSVISGRKNLINAQISAYGRLKSVMSAFESSMSELGSAENFKRFVPQSSDETIATATASSNSAATGLYRLEISRLAQHHKLGSAEVADTETFGGTGGDSLTITVGTESMTLDMSNAMTLQELRDAINADGDNPGVAAALLNTGAGTQRLILTSEESGYEKRMELSFGGGLSAGTFNLATTNQDELGAPLTDLTELDAAYRLDGFDLTAGSNSVSGAIDGVNFQLNALGAADISFDRDNEAILESVQAFADAYNSVRSTVDELRANELEAEATLLSVESLINGVINTPANITDVPFTYLSEIGLSIDKLGRMQVDSTRLNAAFDNDFNTVVELFSDSEQGFAARLRNVANDIGGFGGILNIREEGLNERISILENREEQIERRLLITERRLRSQFSALDTLVANLQSTGAFLFQQLNATTSSGSS